jgi:hypothetical protein
MVKYRGMVAGRKRGSYCACTLNASFNGNEYRQRWGPDPVRRSPATDIADYLCQAGLTLGEDSAVVPPSFRGLNVYHIGGATIALKYRFFINPREDEPAGGISLDMASNDPLDDVVDHLRRRFPYLELSE